MTTIIPEEARAMNQSTVVFPFGPDAIAYRDTAGMRDRP